jgi:hypothetical protein
MKVAKLTPFLAVSPQLAEADLGALAAQGFRAVINDRPDGEAEDQPARTALAAAAQRVGLEYRRARAGGLRSSGLTDPTITITSLGERGAETVIGVIYPPQVGIIGFGRIVERPWAVDGALTVDHHDDPHAPPHLSVAPCLRKG